MTRQSRKRNPTSNSASSTSSGQGARSASPVIEPKPAPASQGTVPPMPAQNGAKRGTAAGGNSSGGGGGKSGPAKPPHEEEPQPAHLGKNKRPDLIGTRPCERFLNGHCNFGKDCWFVHEGEPKVEAVKPLAVPAPALRASSPEPPKPKISLAPTNPWGRVKPPQPDSPSTPPQQQPQAPASPVQQSQPAHVVPAQHSVMPPQPLAPPRPPSVGQAGVVPLAGGSPSSVPMTMPSQSQAAMWEGGSPQLRAGGVDPRMAMQPPQGMDHVPLGGIGDIMAGRGQVANQQQQQSFYAGARDAPR